MSPGPGRCWRFSRHTVLLAATLSLLACGGKTDSTPTVATGTATTTAAGSTGSTTTTTDPTGCTASCDHAESCAPESYDAARDFSDYDTCQTSCASRTTTWENASCGTLGKTLQDCVTGLSCADLVAFYTDPPGSNLCTAEFDALDACLNGG